MLNSYYYPSDKVSNYLIPLAGLKQLSLEINTVYLTVSNYLIPLAGLKLPIFPIAGHNQGRF